MPGPALGVGPFLCPAGRAPGLTADAVTRPRPKAKAPAGGARRGLFAMSVLVVRSYLTSAIRPTSVTSPARRRQK